MSNRKYIRIALSAEDEAAMAQAKSRAEHETGIAMTDSMFALMLIRKATKVKGLEGRHE